MTLRASLLALFFLPLAACSGAITGDCSAADGRAVLDLRCASCHAAAVAGTARGSAPAGVDFDTDADVRRWNDRIRVRALEQKTMPVGVVLPECEAALLDTFLTANAAAACTPSCTGRQCGGDGCGGTCGSCSATQNCSATGQCEAATTCTPSCSGKACGPDGCGNTCGTCAGALQCNTNTGLCSATCTPSCGGKTCGDDGCGTACGTCGAGTTCSQGTCTSTTKSYATDVQPIWVRNGCAGSGCHGGARPAESLNLSSAAVGYPLLVGANSTQCSGKKRVAANDVPASYLINKVTGVGMCFGSKMPKGGGLTAAELDTLRLWITSGALP